MKRSLSLIGLALVLLVLASCAGTPEPPPAVTMETKTPPFDVLQHKGTVLGVTTVPGWITAALDGPKAVERLADYANKYVVVVDVTGGNLEGTQLAASRLNADTEISRFLSIRVQDFFSGAQVGDKDQLETYFERVVKSVSEARFSGFRRETDWWVQIRWYKPDARKTFDHDEYRVMQLYTIDKAVLDEQMRKLLDQAEVEEPKTEAKVRAMDLVQESFKTDF